MPSRVRGHGRSPVTSLFRISCLRCEKVTIEVARVRRSELAYLREHVHQFHPHDPLPSGAGMFETLQYYHVVVIGNA